MNLAEVAERMFLTVPEVAEILRTDPRTIRRAIQAGHISAVRVNGVVRIPTQRFIDEMGLIPEPPRSAEGSVPAPQADDVQLLGRQPTGPSAA